MSQVLQLIIGAIFLVLVFLLSRMVVVWQMQRTARAILTDLNRRAAVDEDSAVAVDYEKRNWLRIGFRDFRPQALMNLLATGMVVRTEDGRYHLAQAAREALEKEATG
jgi:hypothetical protein